MISTRLRLGRLLLFLCGGHRQLALENLALRHQLAVDKRTILRPRLRRTDRLWWVWLARVWTGWRAALVDRAPDSVLRWQRRRVREHGTKLSGRPTGGRPPVNPAIKALVLTAAVLLIAVVVAIIVDPWRGQTWGARPTCHQPPAARPSRATVPFHIASCSQPGIPSAAARSMKLARSPRRAKSRKASRCACHMAGSEPSVDRLASDGLDPPRPPSSLAYANRVSPRTTAHHAAPKRSPTRSTPATTNVAQARIRGDPSDPTRPSLLARVDRVVSPRTSGRIRLSFTKSGPFFLTIPL